MIDSLLNTFSDWMEASFLYLLNPDKRIYLPYLITSFLIAILVYYYNRSKESNQQGLIRFLFKKKYWWSKSAWTDYAFLFINGVVKIAFLAPFALYGFRIAFYVNDFLVLCFGRIKVDWSPTGAVITYTIGAFILKDFFSYFLHYLQHKVPVLWCFHKVHHSATELNPFTQYRLHPVELIFNNVRNILVTYVLIGVFDYLTGQRMDAYTFLGVNVISFVFYATGANLRHSHVPLKYPAWMERIFISPFQHQIHHSDHPEHANKNMGARLAIWDWFFGTLVRSGAWKNLRFGIGTETNLYGNFSQNMLAPFRVKWPFKSLNDKKKVKN